MTKLSLKIFSNDKMPLTKSLMPFPIFFIFAFFTSFFEPSLISIKKPAIPLQLYLKNACHNSGLVTIDDGWQTFCHDDESITNGGSLNCSIPSQQTLSRLIRFEENCKFREYRSHSMPFDKGMGAFEGEFGALENVCVACVLWVLGWY